MENWEEFKNAHYGKNIVAQSEWGTVCFSPDSLSKVVDGDRITYDEYLEIQRQSAKDVRHYLERCYYSVPLGFSGQIERLTKNKICFKRIYVEGMYFDGTCFSGKEDHVWMDRKDFEDFQEGDSVAFFAEIYRYLKTCNGKAIDFGLKNPEEIRGIPDYELPTDKELMRQDIESIVCEMLEPPDGFENAFNALESLYLSYLSFTNIIINCNGSLESFSKDFSNADKDFMQQYHVAELFTKYY